MTAATPPSCSPPGACEPRGAGPEPFPGTGTCIPAAARGPSPAPARRACVTHTYTFTLSLPSPDSQSPAVTTAADSTGWTLHLVRDRGSQQRSVDQPKMAASGAPSSDPKPAPRSPCSSDQGGGGVAASVAAEGRGCSAGGSLKGSSSLQP